MWGNKMINDKKLEKPANRKIMDMRSVRSVNHKLHVPKSRTGTENLTRASLSRKNRPSMDIARSQNVARFAAHKKAVNATKQQPDIGPSKHPIVSIAEAKKAERIAAIKPPIVKTSKQIKDEAIAKALAQEKPKVKPDNFFKRHSKKFNIFSFSAVVVVIIGVLTYFYLPIFSVSVASAQAGIKAAYPDYRPDGYSLSGPVSYSNGEVTINFHANTGNSKFTIKQSKSSWDSSAVKNKVNRDSNGEFTTTEEKGLTIYTYSGNAAWVNGGILYNITGNAPLSGDQIRRIATSL